MVELVRNSSKNSSLDHFADGCFKNFNKVACSRDAVEAVLAGVTVILCLTKIIKLHLKKHELWNQYMIFYAAIIEIILLTINWLYAHEAIIDLVAELLKLFQFLVVCRFYCEIVARMSKTENLYKRIFLPCLVVTFIYFVVLIIVGIRKMKDNVDECIEPEWLQLSCSEVALGIVFICIGVYITRQTNRLRTDSLFKRNIRLSLWGIILSFELSSIISMVYDILMMLVGKKNHCKGVFLSNSAAFTSSHIIVKILKWLLPIWAMIIVFKPDSFEGASKEEDSSSDQPPIVQRSSGGIFTSEFRPRGRSFNYKHLRNPDNESERKMLSGHMDDDVEVAVKKARKKKKRRDRMKSGGSSTGESSSSGVTSPMGQTEKDGVSVSINAS